ncbi:MAG: mechanosensitive ion channel family protein [Mangrovibacterium sp.]
MRLIYEWLFSIANEIQLNESWAKIFATITSLFVLGFFMILIHSATVKILRATVIKLLEKSKIKWDDFLISRGVFKALAHFPTALVLSYSCNFSDISFVSSVLDKASQLYYIFLFTLATSRVANACNDMYQTTRYAQSRSIKGYIQLFQIFLFFITAILTISILSNKNITGILTGLSAMAAVLMLVFKDSILGFVASIQLSANNMLKPGDWIAMPSHGADGTVIDISLNTVKIQNWDKTITTIPTYALVSDSFSNWVGMEESGGRRIKRSINIDMTSVRFCDDEMLEKFKKFHLLKDYLTQREQEIANFNAKLNLDKSDVYNGRKQTNLGIFRHYLDAYLKQHPKIHDDMTFLVRHLQPTERGIPIEIYVFSNDQEWANYEAIQADIFDHTLAILPEFDLRVFQNPSGHDFMNLYKK